MRRRTAKESGNYCVSLLSTEDGSLLSLPDISIIRMPVQMPLNFESSDWEKYILYLEDIAYLKALCSSHVWEYLTRDYHTQGTF